VNERRDACARTLVTAGADPGRTDLDGRSPLHLAERTGQADLAAWLASQVAPAGGGHGSEPRWAAL
jgi:ankyrin repeat protein